MSDRIESLLAQMTLEEKISMLAGADLWHTVPLQRLGIPQIKVSDGPIGARGADDAVGPSSAAFPCGTALASTWNPELVERVGHCLADEVKAKGAHILLAPTVNIHRGPLAGRNFECYSEDPYLTGRMATAYIKGLQSNGAGACIKHFVCNDSEFERTSMSSEVCERALREIYLRPFQMALRDAKPWAVMSSYNRINGVFASENTYTLLDILKGEWGFDGIVMSDWYGTYTPNVAAGGLDLEMPGPARWMGDKAMEAVKQGQVSEAMIDDKVRRLLRTIERVGAFDQPELKPEQAIDRPEHRQVALQAAREALVLLKNNGVLPLKAGEIKSIAVIGSNAKWPAIMGGGSTRVRPHYVVSPLDGITAKAGGKVRYALGCNVHKYPPVFKAEWLKTQAGQTGLDVLYFANRDLAGDPVRAEVTGRLDLTWFGGVIPGLDPGNFSVRLSGAFTAPESGTFTLSLASVGQSRLALDGKVVIDLWATRVDAQHGFHPESQVQIELQAGTVYAIQIDYAPAPTAHWRNVRAGCLTPVPSDSIRQAAALAAESDVAIVFAGLTEEWESEGYDRPDMELPGKQVELIEAVSAANPNTIVVLTVGSPVSMNWLDKVAGVVQAWYTGQESGHAIAEALFGDVNPSGKLPTTWPKRLQDNPAYINYPGENGRVLYGEGIFVGYRYYDKKEIEPLFPFGYGLSYTTYAYRNLALSAAEYTIGDVIRLSVDVENTGPCAGQEIVQVYVRDQKSRLVRPDKELVAFAKVALEPGEARTVTFELEQEALSYYDDLQKRWVVEAGEFKVLVGASARDIRLSAAFTLKSTARLDKGARR